MSVLYDHSEDGTAEVLEQIRSINDQLIIVHRPRKLGLGSAHHLAMLFACKHNYNVLVAMDADHSHDPKSIPGLMMKLSEADFVIGSRYMPGGKCDYIGHRKFLSFVANKAARALLGIPLHEFTTSFRAFRVSALAKVNFAKMHNQGYSFFMESIYRFQQAGFKFAEIPIYFHSRNSGKSKIPRFEIIRGIAKLCHLIVSRILYRKMPMASSHISDSCAHCHTDYLSEYYPCRSKLPLSFDCSQIFGCSNMSYSSKPRLAKCLQCGFIQAPYSEHPKDMKDLYTDVINHEYLDNLSIKRRTFSYVYRKIDSFLPKVGNMLEVGSYCGLFLTEAKKRGWNVIGVEPSLWAASYAEVHFGHKVIRGDLESVAHSLKREFDVIVSWDVLEHVRDPINILKIMNSKLRENGIVALSTLDAGSWFPRLMSRFWFWIMESHLFYFDSYVLRDIFNKAGFELIQERPYRHYISIRCIYRKCCTMLPQNVSRIFLMGYHLLPSIGIPVTLGDVKLYLARKVRTVPLSE
jgi:2-polyprenyl-3-methyl-5-hydroxy-6-metoxy-1,4-benzoquinol methylase